MGIHWAGLRDVLFVGLIAGVGLVALFGVGVRLLSQAAEGRTTQDGRAVDGHAAGGRVLQGLAFLCFAVCAAIAIYGITLLLRK